jgi:rhodanese-related sulfurtransferase
MDELREVSPAEAREWADDGAVLLDVRESHEWSAGRAPGALHVPLADLPDRVGDLDPTRRVVCVCRSGGRSRRATAFLVEHGIDAVNMEGGMVAWADAGGPLESDGGEPLVV